MRALVAGLLAVFLVPLTAFSGDGFFKDTLFPKFQMKACTICHDFFEKELDGLFFSSHKNRTPDKCVLCHRAQVTGFEHPDEWFAMPGLYTSAMDASTACETVRNFMHAEFKSQELLSRQMEEHLLHDPRVLWGIEGATPNSGMLPGNKKEPGLVQGGFAQWEKEVKAWIRGGVKCE